MDCFLCLNICLNHKGKVEYNPKSLYITHGLHFLLLKFFIYFARVKKPLFFGIIKRLFIPNHLNSY